ncbi:MAG: EF-hand domain-containing protein [Planctomycetota bacterium]
MRRIALGCIALLWVAGLACPLAFGADRFAELDVDKSGVIEPDEFPGPLVEFNRLDTNADRVLSPAEFAAYGTGAGASGGERRREGGERRAEGAQREGGERPRRFNLFLVAFDTNKDKSVTRDEFLAVFQQMDANGNGSVDEGEAETYLRPRTLLAQFDANSDGMLTQDEVEEKMWTQLSKLDSDGDGKLSLQELSKALTRPQEGQGAEVDPSRMLQRMDLDGNGKLSRDEWKGPAERFDEIDANRGGYLTSEELQAARGKMRQERPRNQ